MAALTAAPIDSGTFSGFPISTLESATSCTFRYAVRMTATFTAVVPMSMPRYVLIYSTLKYTYCPPVLGALAAAIASAEDCALAAAVGVALAAGLTPLLLAN